MKTEKNDNSNNQYRTKPVNNTVHAVDSDETDILNTNRFRHCDKQQESIQIKRETTFPVSSIKLSLCLNAQ